MFEPWDFCDWCDRRNGSFYPLALDFREPRLNPEYLRIFDSIRANFFISHAIFADLNISNEKVEGTMIGSSHGTLMTEAANGLSNRFILVTSTVFA